ncbi:EamA family transporter RarD [Pseudobdellovibrio exovorus]|uniref:EamA domain-containing protein n=1 Tax=Pseudobdellovibrio exovorus JSS TaxID=1184267 RepID=M4V8N7_9BACT|nr:EamA family transporter RarD [Pseudobdellovibrio exovorus]AGH95568.1 hypothetical protein A11Q_1352 [Pseudobdellovibrio exovorus JSS]
MDNSKSDQLKIGMGYATLAYIGWGFFPIYWKFLKHVPLMQILSHRVIWAFVFYTAVLFWKERKLSFFRPKTKGLSFFRPKTKGLSFNLGFASVLLMSNWLVYIYAVNSGQIVESSLGYFINPLVNILIGMIFLKETLNREQKIAGILAAIGVLIITVAQMKVPWIALYLALSFAGYGLIKKMNPVSGLKSNQFESALFVPVALVFLLLQPTDWMTNQNQDISLALLVGSGIVTGLPLIFFAEAAQRIPYYLLGFFQFLAPTLQFLSGVVIFKEEVTPLKFVGFIFIWVAGAVLVLRGALNGRHLIKK